MKKTNLIIEAVLFVAIVVLFALYFKGAKSDAAAGIAKAPPGTAVYVDMDNLISNYAMAADLQAKFSEKKQLLEKEISAKSQKFQSSVMDYQNKVQKGSITRAAAPEIEQKLGAEQQSLAMLRDKYMAQLSEEEQSLKRQIFSSITEYLALYCANKGYTYIFGHSFGGNILYADKTLNITQDVLQGLNEKYKSDKTKTKK